MSAAPPGGEDASNATDSTSHRSPCGASRLCSEGPVIPHVPREIGWIVVVRLHALSMPRFRAHAGSGNAARGFRAVICSFSQRVWPLRGCVFGTAQVCAVMRVVGHGGARLGSTEILRGQHAQDHDCRGACRRGGSFDAGRTSHVGRGQRGGAGIGPVGGKQVVATELTEVSTNSRWVSRRRRSTVWPGSRADSPHDGDRRQ